MPAVYIMFVGLYLAGLLARDVYELLKKKDRVDTGDTRVFVAVFSAMIVMWVSWFGMGVTDPLRVEPPVALQWLGLAVVVLGSGLMLSGMWTLKGVENIDHLVTSGPFARIRHPMYVGFVLLILGWGISRGALLSLAIGTLGLGSIAWWRLLEERELETRYGDAYAEYRTTTWF